MNEEETWARECSEKFRVKRRRARWRLNAFLILTEMSSKTSSSINKFLRINSSDIVFIVVSSSMSFINDHQINHIWSLLLFRSLRRFSAQLSIITISYSIFISQVVERCNFSKNVSVSCFVSCCCLDSQIQILAMNQRHYAFHDICSEVEATSQIHVIRLSRSWHLCRRNSLIEVEIID